MKAIAAVNINLLNNSTNCLWTLKDGSEDSKFNFIIFNLWEESDLYDLYSESIAS
ncbi:hypothetical protein HMPREF9412_4044 [Paenibacillus sp. HGF5]|nr:hypothetical protein HMPREF9412_4044 [Paenibacillus sp. HGF5]